MKYLIDNVVIFDTQENSLGRVNDDNKNIKLSNTSSRVLKELVIAHGSGETVSRETLFANVWDSQGLQSSSGNLNQQISILRKTFSSLGLPLTAIVTLPKRGLKLNDNLNITLLNGQYALQGNPPPRGMESMTTEAKTFYAQRFTKEIIINVLLILSIIVFTASAYVYFRYDEAQPFFFFDKIDECNIYTFSPVQDDERIDLTSHIKRALNGNIEKCAVGDHVFFSRTSAATALKLDINQRTFLAKCGKDAQGRLRHCLNLYFYNWGI